MVNNQTIFIAILFFLGLNKSRSISLHFHVYVFFFPVNMWQEIVSIRTILNTNCLMYLPVGWLVVVQHVGLLFKLHISCARVPVWFPTPQFPIQVPANVSWQTTDVGSSAWVSATHVALPDGVLGSWFGMAQLCCGYFGWSTSRGKILSLSLSLSLLSYIFMCMKINN